MKRWLLFALLTAPYGNFRLDCHYGPPMAEIRAWDRRGLELQPLYSDLSTSFAVNEACAPIVDQQGIVTIENCYRRLKGRASTDEVIVALAMALWRIGETTTADELAKRLEYDPQVQKDWRSMAAELHRRIAKTKAPAAPLEP